MSLAYPSYNLLLFQNIILIVFKYFIRNDEVVIMLTSDHIFILRPNYCAPIFFFPLALNQSLSIYYKFLTNKLRSAFHYFDLQNRCSIFFFLRYQDTFNRFIYVNLVYKIFLVSKLLVIDFLIEICLIIKLLITKCIILILGVLILHAFSNTPWIPLASVWKSNNYLRPSTISIVLTFSAMVLSLVLLILMMILDILAYYLSIFLTKWIIFVYELVLIILNSIQTIVELSLSSRKLLIAITASHF